MCNFESTHLTRQSGLLHPQFDLMASSFKDTSSSLWDLSTLFVAAIMDAKDFIDQLQATFCEELWPAICGELENSRCRIIELEKFVEVSNKEREEGQQLKSSRDDETVRLRAGNLSLRMELEQVLKNRTRLENDNQILHSKLQSLLEQNLNIEKQRQSLADELKQLQLAAKPSATEELFLKADNQKLAFTRSQLGKNEDVQNRLSLKGQKKFLKVESSSPSTVGKHPAPVYCEEPMNFKENSPVRSAYQGVDQGVDFPVSDLEMKELRKRSPPEMEADRALRGETFIVSLESPPSAEAKRQAEPPKNSQAMDARHVISPRLKSKCGVESRACSAAAVVDSDETVMDVVHENPASAGVVQEYAVVSIASQTEAEPCGEPSLRPSGREIDFLPRGEVGLKNMQEETGTVRKAGPLVSISPNVPNFRPPCRAKVRNTMKGPKPQSWRQTRHRAEPSDMDPHDSFLDTPRERVLAQLEEARTVRPVAVPYGTPGPDTNKLDGGVIEVREGDKGAQLQDRPSPPSRLVVEGSKVSFPDRRDTKAAGSKAPLFKFNEPVRKKRDREVLQGTDCTICKRFYDAVAAGDANGMLASKCEHQDAVSRHRFRYLPPPTPEGFWNIGFDDSNSTDHAG